MSKNKNGGLNDQVQNTFGSMQIDTEKRGLSGRKSFVEAQINTYGQRRPRNRTGRHDKISRQRETLKI